MVTRPERAIDLTGAKGAAGAHVLIIESRYYAGIADALIAGASEELAAGGATFERIEVAGALEIPQALGLVVGSGLAPRTGASGRYDGVIAVGCVIRGETSHYDIVVGNANHWLMETAMTHHVPVGNAILTVDSEAQAIARAAGGRRGKGGDAARACLDLVALQRGLSGAGA